MSKHDEDENLDELMAQVDEDEADVIDLSEAVDFEPLEGEFPVEVIGVKKANGKQPPHTPYYNCKLRVFEGEAAKRVCFVKLPLSGKGASITKRYLIAMGADIDWDSPKISPSKVMGLRGTATCKPEEYPKGSGKFSTDVTDMAAYQAADGADELD